MNIFFLLEHMGIQHCHQALPQQVDSGLLHTPGGFPKVVRLHLHCLLSDQVRFDAVLCIEIYSNIKLLRLDHTSVHGPSL